MSKKVLVVDDDPVVLKLVKSRLEANQYEVTTASDGDEGLQKLKTQKPDLIILDVEMPRMDGYTFVVELKKHDDLKNIPIIILTAKEHLKDLFKLEGIRDYIVKPFKAEKFLETVKKYLA
ncbi:MAG: response regulator [Candidatus Omnitrophota bacterium]